MSRFSRPLWILLFGSAALYGDTGNLAKKSPFMPPATSAAAAPTENAPLELLGVLGTGSDALFNIFDPTRKRSAWVRANAADGYDFVVRAYDAGGQTVQVEHGGRTLSLKLKESKIQPLAANALPQPAPAMGQPMPAVLNPTPADEARRLESVAAEVRRRRALRAAAAQQQQQQQQPQPAQPAKMPPRPR
ncbi:MAG TPA: hypothetical protein VGD81_14520 [Opitutaceae bacterium]